MCLLVLYYHVCGCLEHVKLYLALDAKFVALGFFFEELDASFRIVSFVRDCFGKKWQPRGFFLFAMTQRRFLRISHE